MASSDEEYEYGEGSTRHQYQTMFDDDLLLPTPEKDTKLFTAVGPSHGTVSVVSRVSVKPPVFYRSNPTVWFRQMESQFHLAGITQETTKFHHIMAAVPEDVAINLPIEVTTYEALKSQVCNMYQKSRQELIEEALGSISLEGQKPSMCLLRIKRKLGECHLEVGDDVVKHRLMQAMPVASRTALSAHISLEANEFAKLADTIHSYATQAEVISAVATDRYSKDGGEPNRGGWQGQSGRGNRSGNSVQHDYRQRNSFPQQQSYQQPTGIQQTSTEVTHRPFTSGQRPKLCRYHLYYAEKANRCKPWCKWPLQKPAIIDPASRPGSPANLPGNE